MRKANPGAVAECTCCPAGRTTSSTAARRGSSSRSSEKHARDPFPRKVALRARTLDHPRAFWVEVLEKDGGTAEIDGRSRARRRPADEEREEAAPPAAAATSSTSPPPVRVTVDGREAFAGTVAEDPALLLRSWRETGDPQLAHSAEIALDVR